MITWSEWLKNRLSEVAANDKAEHEPEGRRSKIKSHEKKFHAKDKGLISVAEDLNHLS